MSSTLGENDAAMWYLAQHGQRKGPLTTDNLLNLLGSSEIDGETPVWRKGLADWQPLRATEIGAHLQDTPPPLAPSDVKNTLVWTLAFAPIAYLLIDMLLLAYQLNDPNNEPLFVSSLGWIIPLVTNCVLCLWDEQQLKRAGYDSRWMTLLAVLLAPGYLFARAKRLRQPPTYGWVWVGSFVLAMILRSL